MRLEHLKTAQRRDCGSRLGCLKQDLATASQYDLQVLAPRLEAYRTLCALTGRLALSATPTPMPDICHALAGDMHTWYYNQGNGIFLSFPAAELFLHLE